MVGLVLASTSGTLQLH